MKKALNTITSIVLEWMQDGTLWFWVLVLLMLSRASLVYVLRGECPGEVEVNYLLVLFKKGFWFDSRIAAYATLPLSIFSLMASILGLAPSKRFDQLRKFYGWIVLTLITGLAAANLAFFQEYKESFNAWVLNLLYDNTLAILQTTWETYPVMWALMVILAFSLLLGYSYSLTLQYMRRTELKILIAFLVLCWLWSVALRGSTGRHPINRGDTWVMGHPWYPKFTPTFFDTLFWSYERDLNEQDNIHKYLKSKDLEWMSQTLFQKPWNGERTLVEGTRRQAQGMQCLKRPAHIFLIVMESQDSWPLLEPYRKLGINPGLEKLMQAGWGTRAFMPSGFFTIHALASLINGVTEVGIELTHQKAPAQPYLTALAPLMERLGYKTTFFDAGDADWHRIGGTAYNQGFNAVVGHQAQTQFSDNEKPYIWGLHDEALFAEILDTIEPHESTFNLIMTGSNHLPFHLTQAHIEALGCPLKEMLAHSSIKKQTTTALKILEHKWYGDYQVTCFVENAIKKFGDCLFIITGDHYSRQFLNARPSLYDSRSVPLIIYGPGVLPAAPAFDIPGSHLDIAPTLVELIAPAGFEYHTLGRNLWSKGITPKAGFGADAVITSTCILDATNRKQEPLPWATSSETMSQEDEKKLLDYYDALRALTCWMVGNGG